MVAIVKLEAWERGMYEDDEEYINNPRFEVKGATSAQIKAAIAAGFIETQTLRDEDFNGNLKTVTSRLVKQGVDLTALEELLEIPVEKRYSARIATAEKTKQNAAAKLKAETDYRESENQRYLAFVTDLESRGYKYRRNSDEFPYAYSAKYGKGGGLDWKLVAHFNATEQKSWGVDGYTADAYTTTYEGKEIYLLLVDDTGPRGGLYTQD